MYVRTGMSSYRGFGDAATAAAGSAVGGAISAGVSLATSAASLWLSQITLSHEADTATTQIVNGLEPLLRANVSAYLAGPGTCADQAAALAAFDSAWLWLQSPKGCGNGAYGSAGNACVSDRGPGGKFPWFTWYRDPIANDPRASGCAAATAASNPDAGLQSALANIEALISGSSQQTTAGQFAGGTTGGASATAATSGTGLSTPVAGVPLWVWLAGLGLILVLK